MQCSALNHRDESNVIIKPWLRTNAQNWGTWKRDGDKWKSILLSDCEDVQSKPAAKHYLELINLGERESRERERDRETERHRERHRERDRERDTETETHRQSHTDIDTDTDTHRETQTHGQAHKQRQRQRLQSKRPSVDVMRNNWPLMTHK